MTKISEEVRSVLTNGVRCDGVHLFITAQLQRNLYEATNKTLEALGGKWQKNRKCHVFTGRTAYEAVSSVLKSNGYVDAKKEFELFETPVELAAKMAAKLDIKSGMTVLEPSAGYGRLAVQAGSLNKNFDSVFCVDIQPECCAVLASKGFGNYICDDFLKIKHLGLMFDRIILNPPFSDGQDVRHVMHAYDFLKVGSGNMVAIMSTHHTYATDKRSVAFREWLDGDAFESTSVEELPAGTFKESGTDIRSLLVVMHKKKWRLS